MKLTPICYYEPEPEESETKCAQCGRYIKYTHIALDGENHIPLGNCCVRKLYKSGEIDSRLPHNGRYDWKMSDVRQNAYWNWYGSSVAHAEQSLYVHLPPK